LLQPNWVAIEVADIPDSYRRTASATADSSHRTHFTMQYSVSAATTKSTTTNSSKTSTTWPSPPTPRRSSARLAKSWSSDWSVLTRRVRGT